MSFGIESGLLDLLKVEGGYTNNPSDSGGETNHGITKATAAANGYTGPMKDMPVSFAKEVYRKRYWVAPGFEKVAAVSPDIAGELFDTGVNMGTAKAAYFLQEALNVLNRGGKDYPDVTVVPCMYVTDMHVKALTAYLKRRGDEGVHVLLKVLNCLQGANYVFLAEHRPKDEDFVYGWFNNRVSL